MLIGPPNSNSSFQSVEVQTSFSLHRSQVILTSEGFMTAKQVSVKLVSLFSLSRELLSPQQHYDWGLRALKICLGIAGKELRGVLKSGKLLQPGKNYIIE